MPRRKAVIRKSLRYTALGAALLGVLAGGLSDSNAAESARAGDVAQAVALADAGGPGLPKDSDYNTTGAAGLSSAMKAKKAALVIDLAAPLAAIYVPQSSAVRAAASRQPKCATATDYGMDNFVPAYMYAVSTLPGAKPYGQFPPTRVSMLAFGSIPVSVTVHLSQLVRNGRIQPFDVVQYGPLYPGPQCDPNWYMEAPTLNEAQGDLNLTLSDLTIDQVPYNVGPNCRSVSPVHLNLWGNATYYYGGGGLLTQKADDSRMNGYLLHPGSTDLTIPPFTGCNNNGDDISRLITGMISGPGNEVKVAQSVAMVNGFDANNPTACYVTSDGNKVCPIPPPTPTFP